MSQIKAQVIPTIDVLDQVDGTYDIYYYNMLTKIGQRFVKSETAGVGNLKLYVEVL